MVLDVGICVDLLGLLFLHRLEQHIDSLLNSRSCYSDIRLLDMAAIRIIDSPFMRSFTGSFIVDKDYHLRTITNVSYRLG